MKHLSRLLLCLLALVCCSQEASAAAGAKYVRLEDWARANNFSVRWIALTKTVELSNRIARLEFTVDPRKDRSRMRCNGIQIALCFPVYQQGGKTYISQIDTTRTLTPILSPPKNAAGVRVRTICLDPGHGGRDPGFKVGSNLEKKYALLLAQEVRQYLQGAGFKVVMTRNSDVSVDREQRPAIARKAGADLFVSLHFNAFPKSTAVKGIEVYCLTPAGAFSSNAGGEGDTRWVTGNRNDSRNMLLAYQIQKSLVRNLSAEDRAVKRARFEVLRLATMPAVLVEGGFMSNPSEGKRIFDAAYRKKMARAIGAGIVAYQKSVQR